jgi:hypothetical protein
MGIPTSVALDGVGRTLLSAAVAVDVVLWIARTTPSEGCPIFARPLRKGGRQIRGWKFAVMALHDTDKVAPSN